MLTTDLSNGLHSFLQSEVETFTKSINFDVAGYGYHDKLSSSMTVRLSRMQGWASRSVRQEPDLIVSNVRIGASFLIELKTKPADPRYRSDTQFHIPIDQYLDNLARIDPVMYIVYIERTGMRRGFWARIDTLIPFALNYQRRFNSDRWWIARRELAMSHWPKLALASRDTGGTNTPHLLFSINKLAQLGFDYQKMLKYIADGGDPQPSTKPWRLF